MKALVIGGSGSIGTAIVNQLLADGYEVILHYHKRPIQELKKLYQGKNVSFIQLDLQNDADIRHKLDEITDLDVLVYAAGKSLYGMIQDMHQDEIDACYYLNVRSLILITQQLIDRIRQSEHGRIIVISSIWGEVGASMETIYSTMKAAQIGFVKALSQELALTNVTVNVVTPGFVSGNMAEEWSDEERAEIIAELPQARMVDPKEVAYTCAYLYHKRAQSVTGTVQKVNGGWYI